MMEFEEFQFVMWLVLLALGVGYLLYKQELRLRARYQPRNADNAKEETAPIDTSVLQPRLLKVRESYWRGLHASREEMEQRKNLVLRARRALGRLGYFHGRQVEDQFPGGGSASTAETQGVGNDDRAGEKGHSNDQADVRLREGGEAEAAWC